MEMIQNIYILGKPTRARLATYIIGQIFNLIITMITETIKTKIMHLFSIFLAINIITLKN
jgi:hypothetical protein